MDWFLLASADLGAYLVVIQQGPGLGGGGLPQDKHVLIVGAGPTGIGAAWRLTELGRRQLIDPNLSWLLTEQAPTVGGMAASVTDDEGFTWDLGGHVIYSHYRYFDAFVDQLVGEDLLEHERRGWVWLRDRFIPFPIQRNIRNLPAADLVRCLNDLLERRSNGAGPPPANFAEWLDHNFGRALSQLFFLPYNYKMWAHRPEEMEVSWTQRKSGSRYANVPLVDVQRLLETIVCQQDDPGWAGATLFPYPRRGGAGLIWERASARLPAGNTALNQRLVALDPSSRIAVFASGLHVRYRHLISSVPLPQLLRFLPEQSALYRPTTPLKHSRSHVVGIGIRGERPAALADKFWIYSPDPAVPFFRATILSNYSPDNVPPGHWSMLCEISESEEKPVDAGDLPAAVEVALRRGGFIPDDHSVVTRWCRRLDYGYPVPCLQRDAFLREVEPALRRLDVRSRGRFGGWKYESSNQDNSFMQGVEAVDAVLFGAEELSYFYPDLLSEGAIDRRLPN